MASDETTRARLRSEYIAILDCEPEDYDVLRFAHLLKEIFPRTRTRTRICDISSVSSEYVQASPLVPYYYTYVDKKSPLFA